MWHGPELEAQLAGETCYVGTKACTAVMRHMQVVLIRGHHNARPWTATSGVDSRLSSGRVQAAAQRDT